MLRTFQGRVVEMVLGVCGVMFLLMAAGQSLGLRWVATAGAGLGLVLLCMAGICLASRRMEFTERDALQLMRNAAHLWRSARESSESDTQASIAEDAFAVMDNIISIAIADELVRLATDDEFSFLVAYVKERAARKGALGRKDALFWLYNAVHKRLGLPHVEQGEEEEGVYYAIYA